MNREMDFDQTLRDWLEDGADQAPERFVWAALEDAEHTAQRGAWQASLEGIIMSLKPATPFLGIAAAVVLIFTAYQLLGGNAGAKPTPTPARLIVSADLSTIMPPNEVDLNTGSPLPAVTGHEALSLLLPEGSEGFPLAGFVDARVGYHAHLAGYMTGGYQSWSALFDSAADSQRAFRFLVTKLEVKSTDGWRLDRNGVNPELGDESASFSGSAPAYDLRHVGLYLWRVNNVVLAVFQFNHQEAELRAIAKWMDDRAH
jgi:hypothetical protein